MLSVGPWRTGGHRYDTDEARASYRDETRAHEGGPLGPSGARAPGPAGATPGGCAGAAAGPLEPGGRLRAGRPARIRQHRLQAGVRDRDRVVGPAPAAATDPVRAGPLSGPVVA